jgi:hypothetical protein
VIVRKVVAENIYVPVEHQFPQTSTYIGKFEDCKPFIRHKFLAFDKSPKP